MGIFGRMRTLLKANLNDVMAKTEDPERLLGQLIREMENQLGEAKLHVRDAIAQRKRLEKQRDEALAEAADWEKKAMRAVEAGREDLAREALNRKQQKDELAAELQASWEQQNDIANGLRRALHALSDKIDEAKRRKRSLVARQKRIEARNATATASSMTRDTSAFESFERNAAQIEDFEVEVAAGAELADTLQGSAELEMKFDDLEKRHGGDDALAALKEKMGYSPS